MFTIELKKSSISAQSTVRRDRADGAWSVTSAVGMMRKMLGLPPGKTVDEDLAEIFAKPSRAERAKGGLAVSPRSLVWSRRRIERDELPDPHRPKDLPPIKKWPKGQGVYFVRSLNMVKVGFAADVAQRLGVIAGSSPCHVELIHVEIGAGSNDEKAHHVALMEYRDHGEWFRLEQQVIDYIVSLRNRVGQ